MIEFLSSVLNDVILIFVTSSACLCFQIGSLTQADLNSQGGDSVVVVLCHLLDDPDSEIRYWGLFATLYFLPTLHMCPIDYNVTLQYTGKACQGQTLQLIWPIR
jgi:hypothetical protein